MFLAVILIVPLAFFAPAALATKYSFTTVDVAGVLKGINDQGTIVGMYGFLDASGNFTPMINYPDPDAWTIPMGINNSNEMVGYYMDATGHHHGFLYSGGNFTLIDFPGTNYTELNGINDSGNIVGSSAEGHGLLYTRGNFTLIDFTGGSGTFAQGINNSGSIVGFYLEAARPRGFIDTGGNFTLIDFPGAPWTNVYGINDFGTVVGTYGDAVGNYHSFLYSGGNFTPIDFPGATSRTVAFGINNSNEIVGYYIDATGWHGFVATPIYQVVIDINPNHINPKSNGELSVAILSTSDFDAPSQVDQNSLTFGSTGEEASLAYCNPKEKDINRDGLKDLLCHFYTQNADFQCGDTEGILKGKTMQGKPIKGSDSVRIGPCK